MRHERRIAFTLSVRAPAWLAHPEVESAERLPNGSTRVKLRDGPAFLVTRCKGRNKRMLIVSREDFGPEVREVVRVS